MLNFKKVGPLTQLVEYLPFKQDVYISITNFLMISRGVGRKKHQKNKIFNQNVTKNVTKNDLKFALQVIYLAGRFDFQTPRSWGAIFLLTKSKLTN